MTSGTRFETELQDTIQNKDLQRQIRNSVFTDGCGRIYANMLYNAHTHRRLISILQESILN